MTNDAQRPEYWFSTFNPNADGITQTTIGGVSFNRVNYYIEAIDGAGNRTRTPLANSRTPTYSFSVQPCIT